MWRPKDWENPHLELSHLSQFHALHNAYEAGADAMLRAFVTYMSNTPKDIVERRMKLIKEG